MELYQAIGFIQQNAEHCQGKSPTLGTLLEEVAELARSLEGKHEHHATLELIQIGGIVANMLTHYSWTDADAAVNARESERQRQSWRDTEQGSLYADILDDD